MLKWILELIIRLSKSNKVKEKQAVIEHIPTKEPVVSNEKPYLITEKEILRSNKREDMPEDHQKNLDELLEKINKIRYAWNKPMRINSGYRSKEDHIRIYKELAVQRKQVFNPDKIPWGSAHLKCAAVDISDPDGSLYAWTHTHKALMEEIGVWMELADDQPRVHFQIYPPKSGNRWFGP